MREFLAMGGYAFFVWTAYGVTAVVLVAVAWQAKRRETLLLREIAARANNPRTD